LRRSQFGSNTREMHYVLLRRMGPLVAHNAIRQEPTGDSRLLGVERSQSYGLSGVVISKARDPSCHPSTAPVAMQQTDAVCAENW
jgi:hypothetical protein